MGVTNGFGTIPRKMDKNSNKTKMTGGKEATKEKLHLCYIYIYLKKL
jgi:hypothetical protein